MNVRVNKGGGTAAANRERDKRIAALTSANIGLKNSQAYDVRNRNATELKKQGMTNRNNLAVTSLKNKGAVDTQRWRNKGNMDVTQLTEKGATDRRRMMEQGLSDRLLRDHNFTTNRDTARFGRDLHMKGLDHDYGREQFQVKARLGEEKFAYQRALDILRNTPETLPDPSDPTGMRVVENPAYKNAYGNFLQIASGAARTPEGKSQPPQQGGTNYAAPPGGTHHAEPPATPQPAMTPQSLVVDTLGPPERNNRNYDGQLTKRADGTYTIARAPQPGTRYGQHKVTTRIEDDPYEDTVAAYDRLDDLGNSFNTPSQQVIPNDNPLLASVPEQRVAQQQQPPVAIQPPIKKSTPFRTPGIVKPRAKKKPSKAQQAANNLVGKAVSFRTPGIVKPRAKMGPSKIQQFANDIPSPGQVAVGGLKKIHKASPVRKAVNKATNRVASDYNRQKKRRTQRDTTKNALARH